MFTLTEIAQPTTIEEAYSLLKKRKNNQIIGGSCFLRMGSKRIGTGIELSNLNLDYIKEDEEYIEVGAMTTFRSLETSTIIEKNFGYIIKNSVADIIGVQFRNVVTIGGTVFSKYGFSDLITALLCLDTDVELCGMGRMSLDIIGVQFRNVVTIGGTVFSKYGFSDLITALLCLDTDVELCGMGRMSLEEFLNKDYEKDFLTKIYIKKSNKKSSYKSLRNAKSDYPLINVSISNLDNKFKICIGARPQRAVEAKDAGEFLSNNELSNENIEKASQIAVDELTFGSNMRASKEYRYAMAKVLIKRAIMEVI